MNTQDIDTQNIDNHDIDTQNIDAQNIDTQDSYNSKAKALGNTLLKSKSLVPTFLRSALSSQASGWVDFAVGFVMFNWVFYHRFSWLATAIGVVAGGIVNCILCYKFTFRADNVPWKAVVVKYALVWFGNLILNSGGTELVYYFLKKLQFLENLGFRPAGYYSTARLFMSLMVSWFWNFVLQRNWVYRPSKFDPYAVRLMNDILSNHESASSSHNANN